MRNNKKFILIVIAIIAVLACFALVGCGGIDVPTRGGSIGAVDTDNVGDNTGDITGNNDDDNKPDEDGKKPEEEKPDEKPTEPEIEYTEGLEYEKIKEGGYVVGYSVVGIGDVKDRKIVIPPEYEEKPVTLIASKAFEDCYKITEIILPDTITEIKTDAFVGCERLTYNIYGNAKYLGTPDNPHFALVEKESEDIDYCAVHIDTRITAWNAFSACKAIKYVDYDGTIEDWCKIDFGSNAGNPVDRAHNLYIDGDLVTELIIPQSVTEIKKHQFAGISASKVVFPSGLESIGYGAFCQSSVKSVFLSGDIEYIDKYAFMSCNDLTMVNIKGQDELIIEEAAFAFCDNITTASIDADHVRLVKETFCGCDALRTVTLSGIGLVIGSESFEYCKALTTFKISGTIAKIGYYAFAYDDNLTEITFDSTWAWWNAADKDRSWLGYSSYSNPRTIKIKCSDGTYTENGR